MLQERPCKKKTSPTLREAKRPQDAARPSDPATGNPGTSTRNTSVLEPVCVGIVTGRRDVERNGQRRNLSHSDVNPTSWAKANRIGLRIVLRRLPAFARQPPHLKTGRSLPLVSCGTPQGARGATRATQNA